MIVTIDGPAGAGKSSTARTLAKRLGYRFLDTGAMYRAVTLAATRQDVDLNEPAQLADLVHRLQIEVTDEKVYLDGTEVTSDIRTSEITAKTRYVADNPAIRRQLVEWQREIAKGQDVVTEGRDQATVVFPDSPCKIFLTASPEERARRRQCELEQQGEKVSLAEVFEQQEARDAQDRERRIGGLALAADSIEVYTDGMTPEEVVDKLEQLVRARYEATEPNARCETGKPA